MSSNNYYQLANRINQQINMQTTAPNYQYTGTNPMTGASNAYSPDAITGNTTTPSGSVVNATNGTTINAANIGQGSNLSSYTPATGASTANNTLAVTAAANGSGGNTTTPTPTNSGGTSGTPTANGTTPSGSGSTAPTDTSSSGILDYLKNLIGIDTTKGTFTTNLENQEGLPAATSAQASAQNQYDAYQASSNSQLQSIMNDTSLTTAARDEQMSELSKERGQTLANYSLALSVANNDLTAINTTITDKVNAMFAPVEDGIKNYESLYTLSMNDLSDSEKMTMQNNLDEQKASLTSLQTSYSNTLKTAVGNGAPTSVIQAIDKAASDPNATQGSIAVAAGKYLDSNIASYNNAYAAAKAKNDADTVAGILLPAQNTIINAATTNLDNSQTTKDFQQVASQYANISSIPDGTTDPVLQQSLLMSIAQIYVPGSKSVRGVLNAIQPSDMQSGLWNLLNSADTTLQNKGSISPAQVNSLKTQAESIYTENYNSYNAIRTSIVTAAQNRGIPNASSYIPDYSTVGGIPASASSGSGASVTKGTTGTINGKTYTYNGTGDTSDINNWTLSQ
jgi:ElaB/YqjD/DUF883 family membrane-anchored ribosome-binding protein